MSRRQPRGATALALVALLVGPSCRSQPIEPRDGAVADASADLLRCDGLFSGAACNPECAAATDACFSGFSATCGVCSHEGRLCPVSSRLVVCRGGEWKTSE